MGPKIDIRLWADVSASPTILLVFPGCHIFAERQLIVSLDHNVA